MIPYMLVVGEKDAAEGTVAVRDRVEGDLGRDAARADALAKLRAEVAAKTVRQVAEAKPAAAVDRGAANEY